MTSNIYMPLKTYVIFAEDSAWGTAGSPSASADVGIVRSFTPNMVNNKVRVQGIGTGRNATDQIYGAFSCTGSMEFILNEPTFLQYGFGSLLSGAGVVADPYECQECDSIGYGATEMNTLTFEVGKVSPGTNSVETYDGVVINSMSITASVNEPVVVSMEWLARSMTTGTSAETYNPGSEKPFTFVEGSVTIGSDTVAQVTSFVLNVAHNITTYNTLGTRFINLPVFGQRRYDFTITMKQTYDNTASVLSGNEMRGLFFNGSTGTSPEDEAQATSVGTISLDITEGASADDRVLNFDLEGGQIESISDPVDLGGGVVEMTIGGFALAGLSDSTVKVPCRWYTIV